jgi:hypothetical protein
LEDDWKSIILTHIEVTDCDTLFELCKSDWDIHITSDGGVHKCKGTFGVIISDKATPLVTNHGKLHCLALYESSYRSDAYGILAGITTR